MKRSFYFTFLIAATILLSCSENNRKKDSKEGINKFVASWVQPNPINDKEVQGFTLKENGDAESINMATLLYKKWWADSGKITLISESVGNGVSFLDTAIFEVVKMDDSSLVLKRGDYTDSYTKKQ